MKEGQKEGRKESRMRLEANWLRMTGQRGGKMGLGGVGWGGGEGCWQAGEGQIKGREEGQKEKVVEPKLATLPQLLKSYFVIGRLWQTEEAKGETTVEERARDHDWMPAVEWVFKAACEFLELPWALGGRSSGTAESQKKDRRYMKKRKGQVTRSNSGQQRCYKWNCERGAHRESAWFRGETAVCGLPPRSRESGWQDRLNPPVYYLSIHLSIQWEQDKDMKRPHDYSSPDSDTDEFIDVGQEDSFWWASQSCPALHFKENCGVQQ